jgi:hypothetical protein
MKAMYKYELAAAAGVSKTTMCEWCKLCEPDLKYMGYKRRQHLLTPAMVNYLCKRFLIVID